ncbi:GTP-binding protein Di-Ras1-like [Watersipora subatra]|uniref:GTP-binding protein Di-Ras1-like n=1 Tax=Watersipora subatra TaxID=2589382 RepID=UPI00355C8FDC
MPNGVVGQDANDYRVVVFGSAGVGKSSIVQQFVEGTYREGYVPTIEDTYRKVISSNKSVCTLQVTDTTGSHQFPAMQKLSIQKGHAFVLIYAVNNKQSLSDLKPIYDEIVDLKGGKAMVPVVLVGNKVDCPDREVLEAEGHRIAGQWDCGYLEASAKTKYNVQDVFEQLLLLEKRREMSLATSSAKGKGKSKAARRADGIKNKCSLM